MSSKNSKDIRIPRCVADMIRPVTTSPTNGRNIVIRNSAAVLEQLGWITFDVNTAIAVLERTVTNRDDIIHSDAETDFVQHAV